MRLKWNFSEKHCRKRSLIYTRMHKQAATYELLCLRESDISKSAFIS